MQRFILSLVFFSLLPIASFAIGPFLMEPRRIIIEDDTTPTQHHHLPPKPKAPILVSNKKVITDFYQQVWVKNNNDAIYVYLDKDVSGFINGQHYYIKDFDKKMKVFQANSKDVSVDIKQLVEEKDKVAVYVEICATKININKKICVPNIGIYTFRRQKITEFVVNAAYPKLTVAATAHAAKQTTTLGSIEQAISKIL